MLRSPRFTPSQGEGPATPLTQLKRRTRECYLESSLDDKNQDTNHELVADPHEATKRQETTSRAEFEATVVNLEDSIAQKRRSETQHRQVAARRAWNATDLPEWLDEKLYREQIQPRLITIPLPAIKSALSVSQLYALRIRGGKCVPHPRHWMALSRLAQITPD
jgi:hypothetical protein